MTCDRRSFVLPFRRDIAPSGRLRVCGEQTVAIMGPYLSGGRSSCLQLNATKYTSVLGGDACRPVRKLYLTAPVEHTRFFLHQTERMPLTHPGPVDILVHIQAGRVALTSAANHVLYAICSSTVTVTPGFVCRYTDGSCGPVIVRRRKTVFLKNRANVRLTLRYHNTKTRANVKNGRRNRKSMLWT